MAGINSTKHLADYIQKYILAFTLQAKRYNVLHMPIFPPNVSLLLAQLFTHM